MYRLPLVHAPVGGRTHNLGKCCDWESNLQPLGDWHNATTN